MFEYKAPLRDIRFVLYELLDIESHYQRFPRTAGLSRDVIDAMLDEAAKLAEKVIAPINRSGDEEGCKLEGDAVTTPRGFKEAFKQYHAAGLGGLEFPSEYGGQGLSPTLGILISELIAGASNSFAMYPGLTKGAIAAIGAHGTPWQKQTFLPKMIRGEWTGTMCLTESHAGTDLGLLRTRAVPEEGGTYRITGEKIFISAGEHDLAENIVHLVLAKLTDAPAGTKGISLFVVPKYLPNTHGENGERNAVTCASLEHKMGIKASATCVMVFENAMGYMVGEPHKGLRYMFTMMNVARIGTGVQGLAQGEASRQGALRYARERLQMRALTGPKAPDKPADPIIVHPDVRRMLLTQKAFAEGGRALACYCGVMTDVMLLQPGTHEAKHAEAMLELLTPICKAFLTDTGFESTNLGMQVLGGHGYIREHGMEQYARDCRILQQYEGTNGIQSLDLIGRKVLANGGATLRSFTEDIEAFCNQHEGDPAMTSYIDTLRLHVLEWHGLVHKILEAAMANFDEAGAASYDFMSYSGYVTFAYLFARMAAIATKKLAAGTDEDAFYEAKLATARFFFSRLLPRTRGLVETMLAGADTLMRLDEAAFG
jgi:alkylation response protein AidB-like acyl-CoA dehydrogenase